MHIGTTVLATSNEIANIVDAYNMEKGPERDEKLKAAIKGLIRVLMDQIRQMISSGKGLPRKGEIEEPDASPSKPTPKATESSAGSADHRTGQAAGHGARDGDECSAQDRTGEANAVGDRQGREVRRQGEADAEAGRGTRGPGEGSGPARGSGRGGGTAGPGSGQDQGRPGRRDEGSEEAELRQKEQLAEEGAVSQEGGGEAGRNRS